MKNFIKAPKTFPDFLLKLEEVREFFGFDVICRGQTNISWQINSSLKRALKCDGKVDSLINVFNRMQPSPELLEKLGGKGDPVFEMMRHHQQNYHKAKIGGILNCPGSPLIDFSYDFLVACFFANFEIDYNTDGSQPIIKNKREAKAAVYVVSVEAFQVYRTIQELIDAISGGLAINEPCIILPSHVINDFNDQKPKKQAARYVVQVDFSRPIDEVLLAVERVKKKKLFFKIELSQEWFDECADFLFSRGYTLDAMFPLP